MKSVERLIKTTICCIFAAALILTIAGCSSRDADSAGSSTPAMDMPAGDGAASQFPGFGAPPAMPRAPEAMVVEVLGRKLTQGEVDMQVQAVMRSPRAAQMPPAQLASQMPVIQRQVIEAFVYETVLVDESKQQKITVEKEKIDEGLEEIKSGIPADVKFEELLARYGKTEAEVREDIERELLIKKMLAQQVSGIPDVSEAQVKEFYDSNAQRFESQESRRARHVLVACKDSVPPDMKKERMEFAEKCRARLLKGEDFATIAEECSDCPSKERGGDLGEFQRGAMVPEFETAAFSQKLNEIGPVVKTSFGYHVIEVTGSSPAGVREFDEVKERLLQDMKRQSEQKVVDVYIRGLVAKTEIKYGEGVAPIAPPQPPMGR